MNKHDLRVLLISCMEHELPKHKWSSFYKEYLIIKIDELARWLNLPVPAYPQKPPLDKIILNLFSATGTKCVYCRNKGVAIIKIKHYFDPAITEGLVCYRHYKSHSLSDQRGNVIKFAQNQGLNVRIFPHEHNESIVFVRPEDLVQWIVNKNALTFAQALRV